MSGFTSASFNGTSSVVVNGGDVSTIFTAGAGTFIAVFNIASTDAPQANVYQDAPFIRDANADLLMTFNTSGVNAVIFDGAYKVATKACSTGAIHIAMMRWDGVNLGITVDSTAEVTTPAGPDAAFGAGGTIFVGAGYGALEFIDGEINELIAFKRKITDAEYAIVKAYVNARLGTSL